MYKVQEIKDKPKNGIKTLTRGGRVGGGWGGVTGVCCNLAEDCADNEIL